MLDYKAKTILKLLTKQCDNNEFEIFKLNDLVSEIPIKYKINKEELSSILSYLENTGCIIIKYRENNLICLGILPLGYMLIENDNQIPLPTKNKKNIWKYLILFFMFIIGSLIGSVLANLLI